MVPSPFQEIEALAERRMLSEPRGFELPAETIRDMESHGVRPEEIEAIVAPRRDIRARLAHGDTLTPEQSDRAARLARVINLAARVFGSQEKAFLWLRLPSDQLEGRTPIGYLSTETGARFVEEMLIRIDHGIAA